MDGHSPFDLPSLTLHYRPVRVFLAVRARGSAVISTLCIMRITTFIALTSLAGAGCAAQSDKPVSMAATQPASMAAARPTSKPAAKPELGAFGIDLSTQKTSVKPGDDFFEYANGRWLDTYQLKPDESRYGAFISLRYRSEDRIKAIIEDLAKAEPKPGSLEQKIGDYFASYIDGEMLSKRGIAALRPELDAIARIKNRNDLVSVFGRRGLLGINAPIVTFQGLDRKNPDRYMLNVTQGGLGMPDRDYYLQNTERFKKARWQYKANIATVLAMTDMDAAVAKEAATAILALETAIAKHHWPRTDLRNRDKTYNAMTAAELERKYPAYPWRRHLAAAEVPLDKVGKLNVIPPTAVGPLATLIAKTSLDTWKKYLTYHAIVAHAQLLGREIDDAVFEFHGKVLRGQEQQRERWKRGVQLVGGRRGLGEALGKIYVQRYFPAVAQARMVELVENLRRAFRQRVQGLAWMSAETKQEAFKKLESFNPKIGYPAKWRDFSSVEIVKGDLIANFRAVRKFWHDDTVGRWGKKTDKEEWFMTPQTVNAYYNPSFNEIVFPAAILQPPFFDPHADPAVNYGAIGGVIGHEMGHGFDDQGSKSDWAGIQRNWWTDSDRANFETRTKTLVAQYNAYSPIEGENVNGELTLGENIGDLGGLSMAYHAYKLSLNGKDAPVIDGLTGEQRFFLAWAQVWRAKNRNAFMLRRLKSDPHSPERFRVNGVVRNMNAWYAAFDVQADDKLFLPPEQRVSIW